MKAASTILGVLATFCAQLLAQGPETPYPIRESAAFRRAVAQGTRTETGRPGPKAWTNYARYELAAELNPAQAVLRGQARMVYQNRSPHTLHKLMIHLRQNINKAGVMRNVTVAITGGVKVARVSLNGSLLGSGERGGDRQRGRFRVSGTLLTLRLPEGLEPGKSAAVEMDYSFTVPEAGLTPRMGQEKHHVFYLGYWYPQFAVYDDVQGWVADPYLGTGEFYMDYGDYDVSFTLPAGWIVRATGELQNPTQVLAKRVLERLAEARQSRQVVHIVKAGERKAGISTQVGEHGALTWHFKALNVRDFAISASDTYIWDATHAVVKDKLGPGRDGVAMIHAVYRPRVRAWQKAAEYARHTIEFMSAHLCPYPWPHMTANEGIVGGGMEYPMMTCVGGIPFGPVVESVISHELIHMWTPMLVGSNEKRWAWMDEGLTDFQTSLVDADWRHSAAPIKRVLSGYRAGARRGHEVPCMRPADSFNSSNVGAFYFATYNKTAALLHQLRHILGQEVFDKAMGVYVRRWAYKHPYPYDFFNTFRDVSGVDLSWYWRIWLHETWTMDFSVAQVQPGPKETKVIIHLRGPASGPVEVEATFFDGQRMRRRIPESYWLGGAQSASLSFKAGVREVRIDPDGWSLDLNPRNNIWRAGE